MSIVLFMMFLFSGLMITLICRFTVFSEYEYTQGMYLGVHIPPEEKGSEIVRPFMEKEVKRQNDPGPDGPGIFFFKMLRIYVTKLRLL